MTLNEVSKQIRSIAVDGNINGERRTISWVKTYLTKMVGDRNRKTVIMSILLPDGEWLFTANYDGGMWDYYIPDTREQEDRLYRMFTRKFG